MTRYIMLGVLVVVLVLVLGTVITHELASAGPLRDLCTAPFCGPGR